MEMRFIIPVLLIVAAVRSSQAAEAVWESRGANGNWSDATKWRNCYKPAANGSDSVLMPSISANAGCYLYIDEPISVSGIRFNQSTGGATTSAIAMKNNARMTLGAGGFSSDAIANGNERLPHIGVSVELAASQKWEFNFNGMNNTDWYSYLRGDISGNSGVVWTLAGGKWRFESGSSSNFFGRTYVQTKTVLQDASQFNRLGSDAYLVNTNCFGVTTPLDSTINFYHRDGGTGIVSTALHFDTDIGISKSVGIGVPVNNPEIFSETVFRGSWSGQVHADRLAIEGGGDRYGYGVIAGEGGLLSPRTGVLRFENDMSELATYGKQGVKFSGLIWVVANPKAIGGGLGGRYYADAGSAASSTDCGFRIGNGRAGRLQGLLATRYAAVSNTYIRMATGNDNQRAVTLFGSAGEGYSEFRSAIQIDGVTGGGELPFWLYAEPNGICRFSSAFTYHNGGKRYLPVDVWGGGTVILSCDQWTLGEKKHPFRVRDGNFVVGGSSSDFANGIQVQEVQVGVSHPRTFTVRAMTMGYLKGVNTAAYDANPGKIAFNSTAFKPDGVTLSLGDKVLVNCPAGSASTRGSIYNGIYEVTGALEWTRAADFNEPAEMLPDTRVEVLEGTRWAGTHWFLSNDGFREHLRLGTAPVMTFCSHDNTPVFLPERDPNPDTSLLIEGSRTFPNKVTVVDNQSAGASTLGAYTESSSVSYTGPITIEKPGIALHSPAAAVCSFRGAITGEVGLVKTGTGEVVIEPAEDTLTITNLHIAAGWLTLRPSLLKIDSRTVVFRYSKLGRTSLAFTGDFDFTGWKLIIEELPAENGVAEAGDFAFAITSTGTLSDMPEIELRGETAGWQVHELAPWSFTVRRKARPLPTIGLVRRKDYRTSPDWQPKKLMGFSFLPCFENEYWTANRSSDCPDLAMYTRCIDRYKGNASVLTNLNAYVYGKSRETNYAARVNSVRTEPYAFSNFFPKATWNRMNTPGREQYPFFVNLVGDRPPYFLSAAYPLADTNDYARWRQEHPNFLGAYTLGEFDTETMWYHNFGGTSNPGIIEELRVAFPLPTECSTRQILRECYPDWSRTALQRERAYYFGERDIWCAQSSGTPSQGVLLVDEGAAGLTYEATPQGPGSWTIPGAVTRGAARQFGVPFGWYTANFTSGYTRDGHYMAGENSTWHQPMANYVFLRDGGASRSLMNRNNHYGWLIGCSYLEPENWYHYHRESTAAAPKTYFPSQFAYDFNDLCQKDLVIDRGIVYTPIALLSPLHELISRDGAGRDRDDPWMMTAFLQTVEPRRSESRNYEERRRRGDESCFFNSPIGGIYDIVFPDAARSRATIAKTLAGYKAAFLIGAFRKEEFPEGLLENYVREGGTLIISADKILDGYLSSEAAGVEFSTEKARLGGELRRADENSVLMNDIAVYSRYPVIGEPTATPVVTDENGNGVIWSHDHGKGRVVSVAVERMLPDDHLPTNYAAVASFYDQLQAVMSGRRQFEIIKLLLDAVQNETMPVSVHGDIQWGVNRTRKGWLVWMFNNRGVTKFIGEPEVLDPAQASRVDVYFGNEVRSVTVAPGGVEMLEFPVPSPTSLLFN